MLRRAWIVAGAALLAFGVAPAAASPVGTPPDAPAVAAAPASVVDRVVVVGVPGLRWEDVDPAITPALADAVADGSTGSLSVRSAPAVTCPAEGWLTLGAGGYAAVRASDAIDPALGCPGRPVPRPVPRGAGAVVPSVAALNDGLRFDARPGWLAEQVPCVAAAGPGAALGAADGSGAVVHWVPEVPASSTGLTRLVETCPATLVDAGALPETGARPAALRRVDALVGAVRAAVPADAVVLVLGLAETSADRGHLHVAVAVGPGFGPGWLSSSSTRRVPYVQLADMAPTIAGVLGVSFPDEVAGRPVTGGVAGRPPTLAGARDVLVDADVRAGAHRAAVAPFFLVLVAVVGAVAAALVWLLARQRRGAAIAARPVRALRSVAVGLAAVPAATFLANLVPWWRTPAPVVALTAAVAGGAALVWLAAVLAGRRVAGPCRGRREAAVVAGASLAVVAADAVSGARLQIDSMLGYNPLVAGRFVGLGNIAFAVLGAAALALAAQVAHRRPPGRAAAAVGIVAVPVIAVDGWPGWGADVGGVLTLVPAFTVLALVVAGRQVRAGVAVAGCLGGALAAAGIGWLDYRRPVADRSHFGRFVDRALDGGAPATIQRKLEASVDLLAAGPHTVAGAAATVALAVVVLRPPALLRAAYAAQPWLRSTHVATLVLGVVGLAVNDSIVAVPMVAALVTGPLTLAMCAAVAAPDAAPARS